MEQQSAVIFLFSASIKLDIVSLQSDKLGPAPWRLLLAWAMPQLYSVQLYSANGAKIRSCDSLGISFGTAWYFQPVWSLTSLDRWGGEVVRAGLAQEQGLVLVLALLWELASVSSYMEYIASQEMHSWECWSLLSPHSWALVLFPAPPQC